MAARNDDLDTVGTSTRQEKLTLRQEGGGRPDACNAPRAVGSGGCFVISPEPCGKPLDRVQSMSFVVYHLPASDKREVPVVIPCGLVIFFKKT